MSKKDPKKDAKMHFRTTKRPQKLRSTIWYFGVFYHTSLPKTIEKDSCLSYGRRQIVNDKFEICKWTD